MWLDGIVWVCRGLTAGYVLGFYQRFHLWLFSERTVGAK